MGSNSIKKKLLQNTLTALAFIGHSVKDVLNMLDIRRATIKHVVIIQYAQIKK